MAGGFFFNRHVPGCNDETRLISTLVYQLTQSCPKLRQHIVKVIDQNEFILSLSPETQILELITKPLNEMVDNGADCHKIPNLIILDHLHECVDPKSQERILKKFSAAANKTHIPLLFLIFSQAEKAICDFFNQPNIWSRTTRLLLDDYNPGADIWVYLQSKFCVITLNHPATRRRELIYPCHGLQMQISTSWLRNHLGNSSTHPL